MVVGHHPLITQSQGRQLFRPCRGHRANGCRNVRSGTPSLQGRPSTDRLVALGPSNLRRSRFLPLRRIGFASPCVGHYPLYRWSYTSLTTRSTAGSACIGRRFTGATPSGTTPAGVGHHPDHSVAFLAVISQSLWAPLVQEVDARPSRGYYQ